MLLTPNQISELLRIIDYSTSFFIAENIGTELLTSDDTRLLKKFGVDIKKYKGLDTPMDHAFKFGILSETLGHTEAKKLNYKQIKDYIKSSKFIPLTSYEKEVLKSVKHQSYKDIKGLGNRIGKDLNDILVDVDKVKRAKYEELIRTEAMSAIEQRETTRDLVSRLGHKTGDWNRNFGRISDYIMHTAFDEGRAAMIERESGKDAIVYKQIYPGVCKYCIKLYSTAGIGSRPKEFKLEELIANGNNIGRKANDWLPVIGSTHPFCRCTLNSVPEGYDWDSETGGYTKEVEWERKVKRKSKIKIKVGEKESVI